MYTFRSQDIIENTIGIIGSTIEGEQGGKNTDHTCFSEMSMTVPVEGEYVDVKIISSSGAFLIKNEAQPPVLSFHLHSDFWKHAQRDPDGSIFLRPDKDPVHT